MAAPDPTDSESHPKTGKGTEELPKGEKLTRDFMASMVVFLVALPLCIGIAVACGVPAERGLIAGIVGGTIGIISGAPLLVSGPAASLIVPCYALVDEYGLVALGPVVMLTGLWQLLAGYLRLGQWFRAVAPAVITGMLTGIGVLIIGSQTLVALDATPKATFMQNVAALADWVLEPLGVDASTQQIGLVIEDVVAGTQHHHSLVPLWLALATVGIIMGWTKFKPKFLRIVPGHLVSLLAVTAAAYFLSLDVRFLDISSNFFAGLVTPSVGDLQMLADPILIGRSAMFAFVASAATLLTANAIDEQQTIVKTDYDKEMRAQGVGNFLSGLLGGLPLTGVIVRSSANVEAGAQTRRSTIFHAIWLVIFVSLAPQLLELIPKAALGAILVYTGFKLVDVGAMGRLWQQGRAEFLIFGVTIIGVVFVDLFAGILAGLATAILKIVWTFSRLDIHQEEGPGDNEVHMHLVGAATFVQLPRLARSLEAVSTDKELHVHIDRLDHIDHACLQLLSSMQRQREGAGQPDLHVAWDELGDRYRKALVGVGGADGQQAAPSIVRMVWAEWKRVHGAEEPGSPEAARWVDWIPEESIRLRSSAKTFREVIEEAAPRLAELAGVEPEFVIERLTAGADSHVPLGDGVSLPHAAIDGIETSKVVLVTTAQPVSVGKTQADIFFTLLSPASSTGEHLNALAHIGRMCHRSPLLDQLRNAPNAESAALVIETLGQAAARGDNLGTMAKSLAIIALESTSRADELKRDLTDAFGEWAVLTSKNQPLFELIRPVVASSETQAVLVSTVELHEETLLRALLDERNKLHGEPAQLTILRQQAPTQPALRRVG